MVQWPSLNKARGILQQRGCQDGKSWKAGRTVKCHLAPCQSLQSRTLNKVWRIRPGSISISSQARMEEGLSERFQERGGVIAFSSTPPGDPLRLQQSVPQMALIQWNGSQQNKNVYIWEGDGQGEVCRGGGGWESSEDSHQNVLCTCMRLSKN